MQEYLCGTKTVMHGVFEVLVGVAGLWEHKELVAEKKKGFFCGAQTTGSPINPCKMFMCVGFFSAEPTFTRGMGITKQQQNASSINMDYWSMACHTPLDKCLLSLNHRRVYHARP